MNSKRLTMHIADSESFLAMSGMTNANYSETPELFEEMKFYYPEDCLNEKTLSFNTQHPTNFIGLKAQRHRAAHMGQSNHIIKLFNHTFHAQPMHDIAGT